MNMQAQQHPHRRYNPLTGEWVLVSPHRNQRPWQGKVEKASGESRPSHDPACYLCPGNQRAGGHQNPDYSDTFVFTNDFAALLPDTALFRSDDPLLRMESVEGTSRVICFSPRHDLSMAEMDVAHIRKIVDMWAAQLQELGEKYRWVQIFENKGEIMGCSNPHPHGQIWASNRLPNEIAKEDRQQRQYFEQHSSALLMDYLEKEMAAGERIVLENDSWAVLVPFWAVWPFETLLSAKRPLRYLTELSDLERNDLAAILKGMLTRYDNLFETSFPYTMGWHGAPTDGGENRHWQLHAHVYPPLLRSATIKKFMVGYEMMAEAQRDITAEQAAERLRACSDIHFKTHKR